MNKKLWGTTVANTPCTLRLIILSLFIITSCENPFMEEIFGLTTTSFDANGGSAVASQQLMRGEKVARPANPVRAGYLFDSWFEDNGSFENEWNFNVAPDRNLTLFAKWERLSEQDAVITLSIEQIMDVDFTLNEEIILSKSNPGSSTRVIMFDNPPALAVISWEVAGVGAHAPVTAAGASFTLNANNLNYGTIGGHTLLLIVTIGAGEDMVMYQVNIEFEIRS